MGTPRNATEALATPSRQPASLHGLRVSSPLEADSDRLLGTALRLGTVDENELYQAMDWLLTRQQGIEQRLAKRHLSDNTLVLYDLTSSYFEGHCCPLA